jgi:hypothetical protein
VWWLTSVIPALGRVRQEDLKFQASWNFRSAQMTCKILSPKIKQNTKGFAAIFNLPQSP